MVVFLVFANLSVYSQNDDTHKNKSSDTASILNRRILKIYEDYLGAARDLLKVERIESVPSGTYVTFLGTYPNRKGIKVVKHSFQEKKNGIEKAESKSILLEFTGTTLSKVVTEIKAETMDGSDTTVIRLTDETPLDQNVDDIVLQADQNGKEVRYPIQLLSDDKDRSDFKQEFYLKLLEDFLIQLLRLQEMQNQESAKNKKKLLQTFKDSL
ncbi:endostatin-like outer membrane lipoprotein LenA [Leptospira santarosai]|uniref:endostatin-like outer membrane lipoprotein LenA n=1 Tax=Leptospira santarosai TaxID=28183 RepID=UPI0038B3B343